MPNGTDLQLLIFDPRWKIVQKVMVSVLHFCSSRYTPVGYSPQKANKEEKKQKKCFCVMWAKKDAKMIRAW